MARVRVHQHVNPLSPYYRQEPTPVVLADVFTRPDQPLHLDVGCARGRFILRMAELEPEWNFLGVEIREPLVVEANEIAAEHGLPNLHYEFCNAMMWLGKLIEQVPRGSLQRVSLQFPDPWFKKKHAKRRMVTDELAEVITHHLAPGGTIFVQTDIEFLAEEMFEIFRRRGELEERTWRDGVFPTKTEREQAVEAKELPIYRRSFEKQQ